MAPSLIEETVQAHVVRDSQAAAYIKARAQILALASAMGEEAKAGGISDESVAKLKELSEELPRATALYRAHVARVVLLLQASAHATPDYLGRVQDEAAVLTEKASAARARATHLKQISEPCIKEMSEIIAAKESLESGKSGLSDIYDLTLDQQQIVSDVTSFAKSHLPPSAHKVLENTLKDDSLFKAPLFPNVGGALQFAPSHGDPNLANRPIDELEQIKLAKVNAIAQISAETVQAANQYATVASKLDAIQATLAKHDEQNTTADVDMADV